VNRIEEEFPRFRHRGYKALSSLGALPSLGYLRR